MTVSTGTAQGRWVLAATIGGSSLALLDSTVVNVALARVGHDLHAGFGSLQWVANGYTLSLAGLILLGGWLGDRFGRRRVFLIGIVWFALTSLLCGLAPNAPLLIAARTAQGVGGALLTPASLAIISASFEKEDRGAAIGAWSGLSGIAAAVGPFLGGWLAQQSWRLVFLVNLPVAVVVVAVTLRHVPETRNSGSSHHIDYTGIALGALGLALMTYGLTSLQWTATAAGVLALIAFVVVERRSAAPVLAPSLFANRTFSATNAATFLIYAGLSVGFFLIPLELQAVAGYPPVVAGVATLPVTLMMLLFSARFGALAERRGARLPMTVGPLLAGVGYLLFLRIGPQASFVLDILPGALVLGLGLSITVAPLTAAVLGAAPTELAGTASGVNNAVARAAGLLAVAAVPALVGLRGSDYANAHRFADGFHTAIVVIVVLFVLGATVSYLFVEPAGHAPDPLHVPACRGCAVGAPPQHPVEELAVT